MIRQRYSKLSKLNFLIKEEFNKFLINEIFIRSLKTEYEIINTKINSFVTNIYRFKSNSGNSYDVAFLHTFISPNFELIDGRILCNIIKDELCDKNSLNSVDIGFTLTSRTDNLNYNDDNDIDNEIYIQNTNLHEEIEVMNKISFLIKEYLNNNPNVTIYAVGKDSSKIKLKIYKQTYDNLFSTNFIYVDGESYGYEQGAMYFINKNILR